MAEVARGDQFTELEYAIGTDDQFLFLWRQVEGLEVKEIFIGGGPPESISQLQHLSAFPWLGAVFSAVFRKNHNAGIDCSA
ncbi:MAG: hypothetical protein VCA36_01690 [Opitutales bacterium]